MPQSVIFLIRSEDVFKDYDRQYEKLESICNEPDGPLMYAAAVQSDHAGIRQILDTQSYEELVRKVRLLSFETLGKKPQ